MENQITELVALAIAVIIYLAKNWLASKDNKVTENATIVQNVIQSAIVKSRSLTTTSEVTEELGIVLKDTATKYVMDEIEESPKLQQVLQSLNITLDNELVGKYIEMALHAAKLKLDNVVRDRVKQGTV